MKLSGLVTSLPPYMMLGLVLGMLFGDPTGESANISMIALGFMMTFSMSEMGFEFSGGGRSFLEFGAPALLSFGLLTPVLLAIGILFGGNLGLGWMLAACVPAAIAIVPYSERMRGDMKVALHGEIAIYLLALAVTPITAAVALGASVDIYELLKTLLLLIIIPMGLSRIVRRLKLRSGTRDIATNLAFMIFFMVVVGANRGVFTGDPQVVMLLAVASFLAVFGIGHIADYAFRRRAAGERRVLTMFAALKNTGLAIAVALGLGIDEMALPATMLVIFEMLWAVYLFAWKYKDREDRKSL